MFSRKRISFNFLIEIRPRHLHRSCRLRNVPIELAQLTQKIRPLGGILEFLERFALSEIAEPRIVGGSCSGETIDVLRRNLRTARKDEESLDSVSQLTHVARPVE